MTFFALLVLLASGLGCSAVVNNTLEMKDGDGGGGCSNDGQCDDGEPCNGAESCEGGSCRDADSLSDGTTCNTDTISGVCMSAVCVAEAGCGDGVTQPDLDEECDDGANGDDEDGCTDDCFYSCTDDADCDDEFACNGREMCTLPGVMNLRRCRPAAILPAEGAPCDIPEVFTGGMCRFPPMMPPSCCRGTMPEECCTYDPSTETFDCITMPP